MLKKYLLTFKGLTPSIWILSFVMFINRSGTMVIPFLTIYLTRELGFSLIDTGYVMSFFGLGSLLGTYIGGELTDRYGYYPVMIISLVLTGIMFVLLNQVHTFWSISGMILLTSTVADVFRPANMTAIATLSKEEDRTRSITLIRLAINAGWSIGPAIGGLMIAYIGYDFLFWADGITNILAAIFLAIMLKEKHAKLIDDSEETIGKTKINWPPDFLWFIAVNTLVMVAFFQLFNAIPVYFRNELLLREDVIGALMAINGLILVFFEMPVVFALEKKYNVLYLVTIGIILIGVSYLLLIFGHGIWLAAACIMGLTIGEIFNMPFSNAYTISIAENKYMGKYLAMYGVSFSLSFIIAPILGLFVAGQYGYQTLWILMFLISLLAAAILFVKVLKNKRD